VNCFQDVKPPIHWGEEPPHSRDR